MAHEVFENHEIASIMNAHFVNIKVDREERPDLDDLYMMATQMMTGSGGWPMSVWLTPDLEPFYAGTYFPPVDGFGRPGFPRLELALADAWKNRRGELEAQARKVVEAIRVHADESTRAADADTAPGPEGATIAAQTWIETGIEQLADRFDEVHGGLGSAPKFPPHQALQLWAALLAAPEAAPAIDMAPVRDMLMRTLDGMMNGGIYDHVGGAFARYSTDERWLVPHFEKMLYDSAQLAPVYAAAGALLGREDYSRIARETLDFFLREMRSPQSAFYSALDADSEGVEGKYYVWTLDDVRTALAGNEEDSALIVEHFGLTPEGNWHESPVQGGSVLAVAASADALAQRHGMAPTEMRRRLDMLLKQMRTHRAARQAPALDDKVLTAWNGLMISALAVCGRALREPKYLEAAHREIGFLLTRHMPDVRHLLRVSREEKAHTYAFLDDHAFLLNGLMDLIDSTVPTSLPGTMARKRALELADALIDEFEDKDHGGFFFTGAPPRHEQLFVRMKNAADNALPSANGVAIRALLRLARVSGKEHYRTTAMRAVAAFGPNIARRPEYFPTILLALVEDAKATRGPIKDPAATQFQLATPRILAELAILPAALLDIAVDAVAPVQAGSTFELHVRLTIAPGYHVQPHQPTDREAFCTVARLRGDLPLASQQWHYPPGMPVGDSASGGPILGYSGTVAFTARCTLAKGAPTPGRHVLRVTVLGQPCTDIACFPPEKAVAEFALEVVV